MDKEKQIIWLKILIGIFALLLNHNRDFYHFSEICPTSWESLFWLGIIGDSKTKKWVNYRNKSEISWSNFHQDWNSVEKNLNCVSFANKEFPNVWFSASCVEYPMCAACTYRRRKLLKVRGSCPTSKIDRTYYINEYFNYKRIFYGVHNTKIVWNGTHWVMNVLGELTSGYLKNYYVNKYPIGYNEWEIQDDACLNGKVELVLTSCQRGEYTCHDGTCVPISSRCNKIKDCKDKSDEFNCNVLLLSSGYEPDLAPSLESQHSIFTFLSVNITAIKEFNLVQFYLLVDVIHAVEWKDSRLMFRNLKLLTEENKVKELNQIWSPRLILRNEHGSPADVVLHTKDIFVASESEVLTDDDSFLEDDYLYSGSQNSLVLVEEYSCNFGCQFQLSMYPFDIQVCTLLFEKMDISDHLHILQKGSGAINFNGNRRLLEYELTKETIENRTVKGFTVQLNRVMVSMTSLLVVVELFAQTSQSIPKTAYLKLIDVWYMVLITFDFLVIIVVVLVEALRLKQKKEKCFVRIIKSNKEKLPPHVRLDGISRFLFPVSLLVILVAFFVVSLN